MLEQALFAQIGFTHLEITQMSRTLLPAMSTKPALWDQQDK